MASGLCTNWWRIPDGRISVPNTLSAGERRYHDRSSRAVQLLRASRKTVWADWKTVKPNANSGEKDRDQLISVESIQRVQLLKRVTALAGIGAAAYWWVGGRSLAELL